MMEGRTVVVAGGAGNVGRYLVSGLLTAGARVIVPSRSEERLARVRDAHEDTRSGELIPILGDVTDPEAGPRMVNAVLEPGERLDGAVASLGRFIAAPSLLAASKQDLALAVDGYLMAHFGAARTLVPFLRPAGGSYVLINGPLAFDIWSAESALVSVVTAGQAMLARALMREASRPEGEDALRINELVIHTAVGWGDQEKASPIQPEDIGRYVAYLMSDRGAERRGETIHLKSPEQLAVMA